MYVCMYVCMYAKGNDFPNARLIVPICMCAYKYIYEYICAQGTLIPTALNTCTHAHMRTYT